MNNTQLKQVLSTPQARQNHFTGRGYRPFQLLPPERNYSAFTKCRLRHCDP